MIWRSLKSRNSHQLFPTNKRPPATNSSPKLVEAGKGQLKLSVHHLQQLQNRKIPQALCLDQGAQALIKSYRANRGVAHSSHGRCRRLMVRQEVTTRQQTAQGREIGKIPCQLSPVRIPAYPGKATQISTSRCNRVRLARL